MKRASHVVDAYAQRYSSRWMAGSTQLWNRILRSAQGPKGKPRLPSKKKVKQLVGSSWLMRDVRYVTARSMLSMNDGTVLEYVAGLESGLQYLRESSPRDCLRLLRGQFEAQSALTPEHREKSQQLMRRVILSKRKSRIKTVSKDKLSELIIRVSRQHRSNYPAYQPPMLSDRSNADLGHANAGCDYAIGRLAVINALPKAERIAFHRLSLKGIADAARVADWNPKAIVLDNGTALLVAGNLSPDLPERVRRVLAKYPGMQTIVLDSPGGVQSVGLQLARMVRERKLNTHVSHLCASACTSVLLAGVNRSAGPGSVIGFHDGVQAGLSMSDRGATIKDYRIAYQGLSDSFLQKIKDTPNTSMWVPTAQQLLQAGVLISAASDMTPNQIPTVPIAGKFEPQKNSALTTERNFNQAYWSLEQVRLESLASKGAPRDLIDAYIRDNQLASLRAYWIQMPNRLVNDALALTHRKLLDRRNVMPQACLQAFVGTPLAPALRPNYPGLFADEEKLHRALIASIGELHLAASHAGGATRSTKEILTFLLGSRNLKASARRWVIDNLANPVSPISDRFACDAMLEILKRIKAVDTPQRGRIFRALHTSLLRWVPRDRYHQVVPLTRLLNSEDAAAPHL